MAENKKLTGKQQRDSIVDAYNNPQGYDPNALSNLKAALGVKSPEAPQPIVSPQDAQFQAQTGDPAIAAMQARNLVQAQQDPNMAARLQAMQAAAQQFKQKQVDLQMQKLQALPQQPAGVPTPPAAAQPIPKTPEEDEEDSLGTTYSANQ